MSATRTSEQSQEKPSAPMVAITHGEMGVYLGSALGFGFWTKLDCVGQTRAVLFSDEAEARQHVSTWDDNNDPKQYRYVSIVKEPGADPCATRAELERAGLGDMVKDMPVELVAITHGEMGVYLDSKEGIGFWTKLPGVEVAAQMFPSGAVLFPDESAARRHVASWKRLNDPDQYGYALVPKPSGTEPFATREDLQDGGLGDLVGDMPTKDEIELEREADDGPSIN